MMRVERSSFKRMRKGSKDAFYYRRNKKKEFVAFICVFKEEVSDIKLLVIGESCKSCVTHCVTYHNTLLC